MFKKISIFIGLLFLMMLSVNAGTTYLNDCGKSSGWVDNEIYILNFTHVLNSYPNNYCFRFDVTSINLTFQGNSQKIIIDKSINFMETTSVSSFKQSHFKDINLEILNTVTPNGEFMALFTNSPNNNRLMTFDNVTIKNFKYFAIKIGTGSANEWIINNSLISTTTYIYAGAVGSLTLPEWVTKNYNSIFISPFYVNSLPRTYSENSVFIIDTIIYNGISNIFNLSIIKNFLNIDSNNDNIADTDPFSGMVSGKMSLNFNINNKKYNVIQNFNEGNPFLNPNDFIININDEILNFGVNPAILTTKTLDSSYGILNLSEIKAIDIGNDGTLDCSILNYNPCLVQSVGTGIVNETFRGMVSLGNNIILNNVNLQNNLVNDWNLISNNIDFVKNNITIKNNLLSRTKTSKGTNSLNSRNYIKLKGNNILIFNNNFSSIDTINTAEYIYIESLSPQTNKIYNNSFNNVGSSGNNEVFTFKADVSFFYNNYIDTLTNISNSLKPNLNMNSLIPYFHTDGKYYYFPIGNYYLDNVGCVDSNVDGFCDSSYMSGAITDSFPLFSYPFIPQNHLLTAVLVVNPDIFNISIYIDTLLFDNDINKTIADATTPILFEFSQDSDFPDLTCDFIIDGVSVQTITNISKNIKYNISVNGWTEKEYTYRTECFNNILFKSSNENNFNLTLLPTGGNNGNNGNNETLTTPSQADLMVDVIDLNSISNTNENTIGFMGDIISFIVSISIPLAITISIIVFFLAIMRLVF